MYSYLLCCVKQRINKLTLIKPIQRDEVTQMSIYMTGVWDCFWDKALVYRCNDVLHHKCQLGHGMRIIENVCEDHHKYSYRALVSANVTYSMPCKYKRCGDRTFRLVPDRVETGSLETLVSRDNTRRAVKDD
jgi:hypothetical protein